MPNMNLDLRAPQLRSYHSGFSGTGVNRTLGKLFTYMSCSMVVDVEQTSALVQERLIYICRNILSSRVNDSLLTVELILFIIVMSSEINVRHVSSPKGNPWSLPRRPETSDD